MKKPRPSVATITRLILLVVAVINQLLAVFGKGSIPFADNTIYQIASIAATIIVSGINAWYNNDISKLAVTCGKLFNAVKDGEITEEELEELANTAEDKKDGE